VLDQAGVLTSQMGRLSESVQALRTEAEGRIAIGIDRANELLSGISTANGRIVGGQASDPALLDERDRMIDELSTLMDVQTIRNQNGSVSLVTTAGLTLFNGVTPVKLSFDGRTSLAPQSQYSTDPDTRSVGTITAVSANGVATDVIANRMIRSGEIAAAVEMRDQTLVEAQRQLDDLAAGMARALSDRLATATATGGGFNLDLAGMKPGNSIALDYRTGATSQRVILVAMNGPGGSAIPPGAVGAETDIVIPFDVNDAAASIQAGLTSRGIPLAATDPAAPSTSVRFTPNAGTTLTAASGAVTVTTFDSGYPQLPFFVDSGYGNTPFTGSFEGGSHLTGFAQRITVNPALANRSHLVVYAPGTPQGDTVRPQFILDSLTKTSRAFPAANGIGGGAPVISTVTGFARQVVETQGANAASAQRLDEGQSVALAAIESRFAEGSGVNIDQEMAQLVTLQMAYGANARVMTAVRDMMDMLMRM
jgi:flagellar hook-associated protein 1 FlgK